MPPAALHQSDEGVGGVEHLLIQARCAGEPRVSHGRHVDAGVGHPGIGGPLGVAGPADGFEGPEVPDARRGAVVTVAPAAAVVAVALADGLDRPHPDATSTPTSDSTTARLTARPPANIPIPPSTP